MKTLEKSNAQIVKWGNGQGIRIPKSYLIKLGIKENEPVELSLSEDGIKIKKKSHPLAKHLEEFYGKPLKDIYVISEEESEEVPVGEEVW